MARIQFESMVVYLAYRNGRPLGFSLNKESLIERYKIRPDSQKDEIETLFEEVGLIQGELVNWGTIDEPRIKLHWFCPQCGEQQWGDWSTTESNPCFWGSDCDCVNYWLISWPSSTDSSELDS